MAELKLKKNIYEKETTPARVYLKRLLFSHFCNSFRAAQQMSLVSHRQVCVFFLTVLFWWIFKNGDFREFPVQGLFEAFGLEIFLIVNYGYESLVMCNRWLAIFFSSVWCSCQFCWSRLQRNWRNAKPTPIVRITRTVIVISRDRASIAWIVCRIITVKMESIALVAETIAARASTGTVGRLTDDSLLKKIIVTDSYRIRKRRTEVSRNVHRRSTLQKNPRRILISTSFTEELLSSSPS